MGGEVSKIWTARHHERSRGTWAGGGAVHRTSTRAPGPSTTLGMTNRIRLDECDVRSCRSCMGGEVSKIRTVGHPERSRGTWAGGGAVHRAFPRARAPYLTLGMTGISGGS